MFGQMMDYQLTLDKILEHANRIYNDKKIYTKLPDGSFHDYTYGDLYKRVKRMSKALTTLGVDVGDRVGTFAWNNYQHLELYYAIPGAGAVCHTLNIRLFPEQLAYVVNHGEDKVVFIEGSLLPLFERVADQIDCVEHYVLYNAPRDVETTLQNVLFYEDLIDAADEDYEWRSTDERQAMGMCYTSGTTGDPKGALYSHRSMYLHSMAPGMANTMGISEHDVILPVVPQFHAMCWGLPYACAAVGAEIVMPGPHLKPEPLADMLERYEVTVAAGVPTIWNGLYNELKSGKYNVDSVRLMVVGGSAMPRALTKAYESEFNIDVLHAWGMTETSPLGTVCNLSKKHLQLTDDEKWDIKTGQGYPVMGIEIRIVDVVGKVLPWDGETMGELQVRGPWVISQYFKREVAEDYMTADGWFRTGDVVTISPDGYMNITDRTKDLVKSGGEWISTVELENTIMAHPDVLEAAVIAVPDQQWSERPLAAVVAAGATPPSTAEIRAFLSDKVAKWWIPEQVVILDEIPKTSVGKFDKKVLRARHAAGELK